jgi:hypothetical protein
VKTALIIALLVLGGIFYSAAGLESFLGFSVTADSFLLSGGFAPVPGLGLELALGPAWERQADFVMDDFELRFSMEYIPVYRWTWRPYVVVGYDLLLIDTGYAETTAHGFLAGLGLEYRFNRKGSVRLQGGWRYGAGPISSEYTGAGGTVYYDETWKAPSIWLDLGMRWYLP